MKPQCTECNANATHGELCRYCHEKLAARATRESGAPVTVWGTHVYRPPSQRGTRNVKYG